MNHFVIGAFAISGTLLVYYLARKLYDKYRLPFLFPIVTSTFIIGSFLLAFHLPYETYMIGGSWIDWILGPAVVALACPLYKHWKTIKMYSLSILTGILFGAILGIVSGLLFAKWSGVDKEIIYSIVPKNSTTPVAMDIAHSLGGIPSLTAVFVIIAGVWGATFGPTILKWFRISHFLGKGIGIGSSSHGIGTSKVIETSEKEGAISTIAMIVSALFISILSPIIVALIG